MKKKPFFFKSAGWIILTVFSWMTVYPSTFAQAQSFALPGSPTLLPLTLPYAPFNLQGIKIYPDNPFRLDFMIDPGETALSAEELKNESETLIKYFLASLTVPEHDLWVNLSPYEPDKIIPQKFGQTDMGRDLLQQDYLLKQMSASLMYPDTEVGKEFWTRIHEKMDAFYGTSEIPINTFNKVWVVPQVAQVYVYEGAAVVSDSYLRVMMESDYLAQKHGGQAGARSLDAPTEPDTTELSARMIKELILPELEKEINTGKNFTQLRQIYNALILATWFKRNLKESILGQDYVNQNKVEGIDTREIEAKERIYQAYLQKFEEGFFNFVSEDYDPRAQRIVPRKYVAGGINFLGNMNKIYDEVRSAELPPRLRMGQAVGQFSNFIKVAAVVVSQDGIDWYNKMARAKNLLSQRLVSSGRSLSDKITATALFQSIPAFKKPYLRGLGRGIASAVLLATVAFSPAAFGAQYALDDNQQLTVQVEKGDQLGQIVYELKQAQQNNDPQGYSIPLSNPLWAPGGAVDAVGKLAGLMDANTIFPNDTFTLPTGDNGVVTLKTAAALAGVDWQSLNAASVEQITAEPTVEPVSTAAPTSTGSTLADQAFSPMDAESPPSADSFESVTIDSGSQNLEGVGQPSSEPSIFQDIPAESTPQESYQSKDTESRPAFQTASLADLMSFSPAKFLEDNRLLDQPGSRPVETIPAVSTPAENSDSLWERISAQLKNFDALRDQITAEVQNFDMNMTETLASVPQLPEGKPSALLTTSFLSFVGLALLGRRLRNRDKVKTDANEPPPDDTDAVFDMIEGQKAVMAPFAQSLKTAIKSMTPAYAELMENARRGTQEQTEKLGERLTEQFLAAGSPADDLNAIIDNEFLTPSSRSIFHLALLAADVRNMESLIDETAGQLAQEYVKGQIDDETLYYQLSRFSGTELTNRLRQAQSALDAFFTQNPFSPRGQDALASAIDVVFTRTWESRDAGDLARGSYQAWWDLLSNSSPDFNPLMQALRSDDELGRELDVLTDSTFTHESPLIPSVVLRTVQMVAEALVDKITEFTNVARPDIQRQVEKEFEPLFALLLLDGWMKHKLEIFEPRAMAFYQDAIKAAVASARVMPNDRLTPIDSAIRKINELMVNALSEHLDIAEASLGVAFGIDALKATGDVSSDEIPVVSSEQREGGLARAPPVSGWKGDTFSSLAVAALGWLVGADAETIQISAVSAPFIYRSVMTASYWLHEVTHTLTAGTKNWTKNNFLGNIAPAEWGSMLIPFYGDIPTDIHVRKIDGSRFSTPQRSLAFLTSAAVSAGSVFAAGLSLVHGDLFNVTLWSSIALGTLPVAIASFKSDIWSSLRGEIDPAKACCGVVVGVFKRPEGDTSIINTMMRGVLERMGVITDIRGRQQGGFFTQQSQRDGKTSWLSTKTVNAKRSALPERLFRAVRLKLGISQYVRGAGPVGDAVIAVSHYRYSTSSAPKNEEGQPVQWEADREVLQIKIVDGRFEDAKVNLSVVTTANGDFNFYKIYNQLVDNERMGWWLERVLHTPNDLNGDTPKMGGMMDFLITQGVWNASVRYAFYTELVDSFEYVFGGVTPSKEALSQAVPQEVLERVGNVFREIFERQRDQLISQDVETMTDIWIDPRIEDNQLTDSQKLRRDKILELQDVVFTELSAEEAVNGWGEAKIRNFIRAAFEAFLTHDEFTAVKKFLKQAEGSFGMAVASTLNTQGLVAAADGQPLAIGWNPDHSIQLVASEPAALKIPLDESGNAFLSQMIQLKQDSGRGEIAIVSVDGLRVYSRDAERFLTEAELEQDQRVEPLQANPFVDPLPPMGGEDPVKEDLARIPKVLHQIKTHWEDENSMNRQTHHEFFKLLLKQKITKQIQRQGVEAALELAVSSRARDLYSKVEGELGASVTDLIAVTPTMNWDAANKPLSRMVDLFKGAMSRMFERDRVDALIAQNVDSWVEQMLSEGLDAYDADQKIEDFIAGRLNIFMEERFHDVTTAVEQIYQHYADTLKAEYRSQVGAALAFGPSSVAVESAVARSMDSFSAFFRNLGVEPGIPPRRESPDVLVMGVDVSLFLGERFAKDMMDMFPELKIVFASSNEQLQNLKAGGVDKETVVLAISQSGQTFPTLNATLGYENLAPGRVFVLTGEWKTLMGYAVGQKYTPDAKFSGRVFSNLSGFRVTEPPSYSADATHATLTEILLQLARDFRRVYPFIRPLGLELENRDIVELERMRDTSIEEAERLAGISRDGQPVESAERASFVKQARQWARNVLDVPLKTMVSRLNLYVGLPMIAVLGLVGVLASWIPLTPVTGLIAAALIFGAYYDALPYGVVYLTRFLQKRDVFARVGNRTVLINDVPHVHELLTQFLSKMNSLSLAGTAINVYGEDPADGSLHRFGHRVTRGLMIYLNRPDGRLNTLSRIGRAGDMNGKQGRGVRNFGVGAEVVSVGRKRSPNPNAADVQLTIEGEPATENPRLMMFYENRFDSLSRSIAGQVFFYEMMKAVVSPNLPAWARWMWPWKHDLHRTQSGTVIATTAAPAESPTSEDLQVLKNETPHLNPQQVIRQLGADPTAPSSARSGQALGGEGEASEAVVVASPAESSDQAMFSADFDGETQVGGIDLFMGDILKVDGIAPAFEMNVSREMLVGLAPGVYAPLILDIQSIPSVNMFLK